MELSCFQIGHELKLTSHDFESAVKMAKSPNEKIWLDVRGAETAQLEDILARLEVNGLPQRLCLDARERPGFYPMRDFIFVVIPVQASPENEPNVECVAFLCRKNLLVTMRATRETRIQQITTLDESSGWLHNDSIEGLIATIMMVFSLDFLQQLSELRDVIATLELQLDKDPEHVDISEISGKRSKLLTLEAVINGQLPVLEALMATKTSFFPLENAWEHLASALANLKAADRSLHWLEGRLDVIRSDFEMRAQDKMNRRLGRLTVLSTIFMPVTFIASVWGMNLVELPAQQSPYGFMMVMGFMSIIGIAMFFYFRWKGWFQ